MLRILLAFERQVPSVSNSPVLAFENEQDSEPVRRQRTSALLASFGSVRALDDTVFERAVCIKAYGIADLDALHLAAAEAYGASPFVTCDDTVLARGRSIAGAIIVATPTDFVKELRIRLRST